VKNESIAVLHLFSLKAIAILVDFHVDIGENHCFAKFSPICPYIWPLLHSAALCLSPAAIADRPPPAMAVERYRTSFVPRLQTCRQPNAGVLAKRIREDHNTIIESRPLYCV